MRLFFKHLFRSVRSRPVQPIILLVTLILSVAVSVCVLTMRSAIFDEKYYSEEESLGSADVKITLNSGSSSRFMFTDDVRRIIGEECSVAGYYEIILTRDTEGVFPTAAVNFEDIDDIFRLEFTEYGGINESSRDSSAFVSADFAEANGLSLGESFTAGLFGKEKTYKVVGISERSFIGRFEVLVDISGVVKALASESAFAAALGDGFRPCNTILIDLPEGADVTAAIDLLLSDGAFADRSIENVSSKGYADSGEDMLGAIVNFAIVLCCIMTSVVAYSCFSILAAERNEENYSFVIAGAKPSLLYLMQYCEVVIYWLVGSVFGVALTIPGLRLVKELIGFKYASAELTAANAALSVSFLLLSLLLTVTFFLASGNRRRENSLKGFYLLPIAALCALLYLLTYLVPLDLKKGVGMATAVVLLLLGFLASGRILRALVGFINQKREAASAKRGVVSSPALHYSLKNLLTVRQLHSAAKMLTLLLSTVMCICYTVNSLNGNFYLANNLFRGEYVVLNGTARCYERVSECESVKSVDRLYFSEGEYDNEIKTNLISMSNISAFDDEVKITHQPRGDEAVISYAEAKALSLEVGDRFTVKRNDVELNLRVAEIVRSGIFFVLFDCEHFGIDYTMLIPNAADGVSSEELLGEISAATAEEVASVVKADAVGQSRVDSVIIYVRTGNILLATISVFALIGIVDTFIECYRSRKEEFSMYRAAGMSKRRVRRMMLLEILLALSFAFLLGVAVFFLAVPVIGETMLSICFDVKENFFAWIESLVQG